MRERVKVPNCLQWDVDRKPVAQAHGPHAHVKCGKTHQLLTGLPKPDMCRSCSCRPDTFGARAEVRACVRASNVSG